MAQVLSHVIYILYSFQDGQDLEQLAVVRVIDEGADGQCVVRLEDVRMRGVVDDDSIRQIAPQAQQVLHIVALVRAAGLPKQPPPNHATRVEQVEQRVGILCQAGSRHRENENISK